MIQLPVIKYKARACVDKQPVGCHQSPLPTGMMIVLKPLLQAGLFDHLNNFRHMSTLLHMIGLIVCL